MNSKQRRLLIALGVPAVILVIGLGWAGSAAYDYTESAAFCASQCHAAMLPQASAHARSRHTGVACVQCHASGGTAHKLRTKLAGSSRVVRVALDNYERPIRSDSEHLALVSAQCRSCHEPVPQQQEKPLIASYFRFDEGNTPERITLTLKLGAGRASDRSERGAHSHVSAGMRVAYATTDPRHQDIPWVSVHRLDGTEATYTSNQTESTAASLRKLPRYEMDCITCHNRAGHRIASPDDTVELALRNGEISPTLPWIKRLAVSSVTDGNVSKTGLRHALFGAYQVQAPRVLLERPEDVERASVALGLMLGNVSFPALRTNWSTYPDNLGHLHWPGCFRCHDGRHATADGKVLASDCDHTCHSQPVRESQMRGESNRFGDSDWHPWPNPTKTVDIDGHRQLTCPSCHRAGGVPKSTCDDCHSG